MDRIITHSQMSTFKTCHRKHEISYLRGIRPMDEVRALRMGTAFHEGLDRRAKGEEPEAIYTHIRGMYDKSREVLRTANQEIRRDLDGEEETVLQILAVYFWRWKEMDAGIEIVASELSFAVPIINPDSGRRIQDYEFGGKIDKIVRLADSRLAIMEHKSTSMDIATGSNYWRRLRIDSQISGYFMAARQLGYDVETILYDVVRKPAIRISEVPDLDAEGNAQVFDGQGNRCWTKDGKRYRKSPEPDTDQYVLKRPETVQEFGDRLLKNLTDNVDAYFVRQEIARLTVDIDEAKANLYDTVKLMHESARTGRHPTNTAACVGFGVCAFFDICTGGGLPEGGGVPDGFVHVENVHQEL